MKLYALITGLLVALSLLLVACGTASPQPNFDRGTAHLQKMIDLHHLISFQLKFLLQKVLL